MESLQVGERVMARDFSTGGRKWLFGKVIEKLGGAMVKVELDDGRIWHRHLDHVTRSQIGSGIPVPEQTNGPDDDDTGPSEQSPPEQPPPDPPTNTEPVIDPPVIEQDTGEANGETVTPATTTSVAPTVRRSSRARHPPDRYQ